MMVFKRKQVVILSLFLMIVVAGYLQYSYRKSSVSAVNTKNSGRLGEAVYVNNEDKTAQNTVTEGDTPANNSTEKSNTKDKASSKTNDYFAQARLDREVARSKDTDVLKEISDDINADKSVRTEAYEKMIDLVGVTEKEMRVENLIKQKGYADVLAMIGEDESIDIVVKASSLTSAETAQIADIASRQANIPVSSIHIRNIY